MTRSDLGPFLRDFKSLPRSTALVRENGVRVVLLHLKAGESIPEHQAPGTLTVQCFEGDVNFSAGGEQMQLTPGSLISVAPRQPHSLIARQESLLLATITELPLTPTQP